MENDIGYAIYYIVFLLLLCSAILNFNKSKKKQLLKYLAIWLGIFLLLISAYSFKDVMLNNQIVANLKSNHGVVYNNKIKYFMADDGHFYLNAKLNNKTIEFLVDTGATDIMITKNDARLLGINVDELSFNRVYMTANGPIKCATYLIEEIKIKDFIVKDIYVTINPNNSGKSLLGMRFLQLFEKYEVRNNILTLYK